MKSELWTYQRCTLVKVVDGDTIDVSVDLGWGVALPMQSIRFYGINADEIKTPTGKLAAARLVEILAGVTFMLQTLKDKHEKYGRMLGIITVTGQTRSVNQQMVDEGFAKPYMVEL